MTRSQLAAALATALLLAAACGSSPAPGAPPLVDRSGGLPANDLSTSDVLAADLDGDGDLDLAWASQPDAAGGDGGIDVTLNLGQGRFAAAPEDGFLAAGSWSFVAAADVDGDGDLDLVLSRPATSRVELLLLRNDGHAGFTQDDLALPAVTGTAHGYVFGRVAAGDVDGDGDADLVVPVFADTTFTATPPNLLLLNDGGGSFAIDGTGRLPALPTLEDATLCVALADVDEDGDLDLFLGEGGRRARLLVNDGTGTFQDQSADDGAGLARLPADPWRANNCLAADLDKDGDLDLVVTNDAPTAGQLAPGVALKNDGAGHFTAASLPSTDAPHDARGLAVADVDRDGKLDLVVTNATEFVPHGGTAIEVLRGRGDGTFTPMAGLPRFDVGAFGVAAGDLDGDGWPDLAIAVAEPAPGTTSMANVLLRTGAP